MSQPNLDQLINEYAYLEHQATLYTTHGTQVPADVALRMEQLVSWGRVNINPASFPAVIQRKDQIVSRLHEQLRAVEQERETVGRQERLDQIVGKVTRGILGKDKLTA